MKFDLNSKNGIADEDNILTSFIIGTGVGHSIVKFEDEREIFFSNGTTIVFAQYMKDVLAKKNIKIDINNYMNSTVLSFEYDIKNGSNEGYISTFNEIVEKLLDINIDNDSFDAAIDNAKKDMESNFKINEYRATMKFMEMFSDYYNFNLKSLINDIWNFDVKDLLTFKKEMIFYENCIININKDIDNKEKLLNFSKLNHKFSYLVNENDENDVTIEEEARHASNYIGYHFNHLIKNDFNYNYANVLILGYHIFNSNFQVQISRKEIGILGQADLRQNDEKSVSDITDDKVIKYKEILINSINNMYHSGSEEFNSILAKLFGDNLSISKILDYLKNITLNDFKEFFENMHLNVFEINFKEA